jgi:hypothetical protein
MLYSADVDSVAKPVSVSAKVAKKAPRKKRKTLDQQMVEKQLEIKEKEKELEEALKKPEPCEPTKLSITPPPSVSEVEVEKPIEKPIEKPEEKLVEKIKVSKDDNDPPAWFKTFISNAKQQESRIKEPKKPRKQVKVEAEKIAQQQWNDEYTRNRYNQQADQHMRKMHQLYNQMFYR